MIPRQIFTGFAKFQLKVSVNDFWFPILLHELWQALLCFLRSFCSARIRLDLLGGHVLHHDCISMIVSRFTVVTENLVICCYQVTKIFTRGTAPPLHLLHGALVMLVPLTDLAISVFGEVSINTALTQILTSLGWALSRYFMRRTGVRISVYWNIIHQRLPRPESARVLPFYLDFLFVFGYWLARNHLHFHPLFLESHYHLMLLSLVKKTSLKKMYNNDAPLLVSLKTDKNWRTNPTSLEPRLERSSQCYRLSEFRFEWDVVFDHWSIRRNTRFHRKAFRGIRLLACFRRLS